MSEKACRPCKGRGWLIVAVFGSQYVPDGSRRIERCDACQVMTDDEARARPDAQAALAETLLGGEVPA